MGAESAQISGSLEFSLGPSDLTSLEPVGPMAPGDEPDWDLSSPPSLLIEQYGGSGDEGILPDADRPGIWVAEVNGDAGQATRIATDTLDPVIDQTGDKIVYDDSIAHKTLTAVTRDGTVLGSVATMDEFPTAAWLRDGSVAFVDGGDVRIWDLMTGTTRPLVPIPTVDSGYEVAALGDLVAAGPYKGGQIELIRPSDSTVLASWNDGSDNGNDFAMDLSGDRFLTARGLDGPQMVLELRSAVDGHVIASCRQSELQYFAGAVWISDDLMIVGIDPTGTQVETEWWLVSARSLADCSPIRGYSERLFDTSDPALEPRRIEPFMPHQWQSVQMGDQLMAANEDGLVAVMAIGSDRP